MTNISKDMFRSNLLMTAICLYFNCNVSSAQSCDSLFLSGFVIDSKQEPIDRVQLTIYGVRSEQSTKANCDTIPNRLASVLDTIKVNNIEWLTKLVVFRSDVYGHFGFQHLDFECLKSTFNKGPSNFEVYSYLIILIQKDGYQSQVIPYSKRCSFPDNIILKHQD